MARPIAPEDARRLATAAEVFFHALDTGILGKPGAIEAGAETAYVAGLRQALATALGYERPDLDAAGIEFEVAA